jgi:hypothetical protein
MLPLYFMCLFGGLAVCGLKIRTYQARVLELMAAVALVSLSLRGNAARSWHRDDYLAYDYVKGLARELPAESSVLVNGDTALFGLRYLHALHPEEGRFRLMSSADENPRGWIESQNAQGRPVYVVGFSAEALKDLGLWGNPSWVCPRGLLQRIDSYCPADDERTPWVLSAARREGGLEDDSYDHDARLSFAFPHYLAGVLAGRWASPWSFWEYLEAASWDPEDYKLSSAGRQNSETTSSL